MSDTEKPETADRLAKVMARAGLCSRRDAEGWITAGRVTVNGKKVVTPAFNVTSRDKIVVDGEQLAARQGTRIWLYHKPAGLVVTERDPEGRKTIFEALLEEGLPRVVTVGRLDINTEGLLLLTNDGGLKRVLELPSTGWLRRYRVRAHGSVTQAQLDALKDGIEVDGITYGPIEATLERAQGSNVWLLLGLREGKNREVKNVLGALGLEVNRLIRVSYGPFQLGDLPEGAVEVVRAKMLRDQLGKKLAEAAGVDFDSEMPETAPRPREDERMSRGARGGFAGRDTGRPARPRRVHFDEDGRAPEEYEPKGAGRPRRDRDDQPASSFGKRAPRPEGGDGKSFGDRPRPPRRDDERGERPARPYGD
ncbi:MAG: rRNA pseudouridine synthase, partial [Devosia sp.]|nr:rRNA pseudouridine synthase [Devosia sp.]